MANLKSARKYHFIYKTTNLINSTYYIGMHSTNKLSDGYVGSGKRLWYSIRKYGIENFECKIMEFLPDRDSLVAREKELVNEETLSDIKCLNLIKGGKGGFSSETARKGAIASNEKQRTLRESDPQWVAKKAKRCSEAHTGQIGFWKGKPGFFEGKVHSADTRARMSAAKKHKGVAESNSQFGTVWINNGTLYKKIKRNLLNEYLANGWSLGRSGYKTT